MHVAQKTGGIVGYGEDYMILLPYNGHLTLNKGHEKIICYV